ncbi:TMV resistance protein N-like [Corylus avellana]|nr:TMV resistance protein N-like [Corylus avellana]
MEEIRWYTGLSPAAFFTSLLLILMVVLYRTFVAMKNSSNTNEHSSTAFRGASSTSSSSSIHPCRYDVFLSFRGKDTRLNFTAHLHQALHQKGINTFIDDEELRSGEEISSALLKVIGESKISIVIFSKDYASSKWCLDELLKIVETKSQQVIPVFYKVNPSDVRYQKGNYKKALAKHAKRLNDDEKVKKWKAALKQVANLSGWDLENYRNEAEFIYKIVQNVSAIVNDTYLPVAKHPVGIESRVNEINSLLSIEKNDHIRMVGILGAGGIGKTTIAQDIYNLIASQFEVSCFLPNVRETSKQYLGMVQLQNTLLSKILGRQDVKVDSIDQGITMIKKRFCSKRVLLILDDVDDKLDQLDKLAGEVNWFGLGSRIIITTRDRKVLTNHGVADDLIYEVKELYWKEALELFCWNAFKKDNPPDDFLKLVEYTVSYVGGLPLALVVLGSYFHGKDIQQWISALNKWNANDIKMLDSSYNSSIDAIDVDSSYEYNNYSSIDGIDVLIESSLITIHGNVLEMHNLLRDIGREIVRQESPEDPSQRSRLWFHEDVRRVLENGEGTNKIQGILVDLPEGEDMVQLSSKAFENMTNLRLLMVTRNARFSTGPNFLPNTLRVLEWPNCPSESLPSNFRGRSLIVLRMDSSLLKDLKEIKNFQSTTIMDFSNCELLEIFPDVSSCQNLEYLVLDGCRNLAGVHDSVGLLKKLVSLSLNQCRKLGHFPRMLNLKSLKRISAKYCSRLEYFPDVSNCPNLEYLTLDGCKNLAEVHDSVGLLQKIVSLSLVLCYKLNRFPRRLKSKSLKRLYVHGGSRLEYFPEIECQMECLETINFEDTGIKELPSSIAYLIGLKVLNIAGNKNLMHLPSSIYQLQCINLLYVNGCSNLVTISDKMKDIGQYMPSNESEISLDLDDLLPLLPPTNSSVSYDDCSSPSNESEISLDPDDLLPLLPPTNSSVSNDDCSSIVFPKKVFPQIFELRLQNCDLSGSSFFTIFNCSSTLQCLYLSGSVIDTIPPCIERFVSLSMLHLDNCKQLQKISRLPPKIKAVSAEGCKSLETFLEEPQTSQLFSTWSYPEVVRYETTCSARGPAGSGAPSTTYQNVQSVAIAQPLKGCWEARCFECVVSGNKIPDWFNYHKKVSNSNSCEIDIDEHADMFGEFTIIAFSAVAETVVGIQYVEGKNVRHGITAYVITRGVKICCVQSYFMKPASDFVWMQFHVPHHSFKLGNVDHVRVKFEGIQNVCLKSCGFHLVRLCNENAIDLIDGIQLKKGPHETTHYTGWRIVSISKDPFVFFIAVFSVFLCFAFSNCALAFAC